MCSTAVIRAKAIAESKFCLDVTNTEDCKTDRSSESFASIDDVRHRFSTIPIVRLPCGDSAQIFENWLSDDSSESRELFARIRGQFEYIEASLAPPCASRRANVFPIAVWHGIAPRQH